MLKNRARINSLMLFLIGLGSMTQVHFVGSLGISEFPVFIFAPFLFVVDYKVLKRDGFLPLIWLIVASCIGLIVGGFANGTPGILILKGEAIIYSMFAFVVVLHHYLRDNLGGLKWLLVGIFLSSIISVFIFQPETYTAVNGYVLEGEEATKAVIGNPLFWSGKISNLLRLPIETCYLKTPLAYSVIIPVITACIYIFFSESSGRSAAATAVFGSVLILLGRKSALKISSIGKNMGVWLIVFILTMVMFVTAYKQLATTGALGENAKEKYEKQTHRGTGIINLLMAGRVEFFVGIRAALDKPILGYGPKPVDKKGYYLEYLIKYGEYEDVQRYLHAAERASKEGLVNLLPSHSIIASAWLNYGISGLILWLYIMSRYFVYFKKYAYALPQYFGYLAMALAKQGWDLFFSGHGFRIITPLPIICVLLVIAVAKKRIPYRENLIHDR